MKVGFFLVYFATNKITFPYIVLRWKKNSHRDLKTKFSPLLVATNIKRQNVFVISVTSCIVLYHYIIETG